MLKTDQNLKVLEKKIRQTVSLVEALRKERKSKASRQGAAEFGDLPLLQGLLPEDGTPPASREDWERERKEVRSRIRRLMEEIERVID